MPALDLGRWNSNICHPSSHLPFPRHYFTHDFTTHQLTTLRLLGTILSPTVDRPLSSTGTKCCYSIATRGSYSQSDQQHGATQVRVRQPPPSSTRLCPGPGYILLPLPSLPPSLFLNVNFYSASSSSSPPSPFQHKDLAARFNFAPGPYDCVISCAVYIHPSRQTFSYLIKA